ncbi:MAG: hypothetical protein Fur0040_10460 [Sideroxydans sp.]
MLLRNVLPSGLLLFLALSSGNLSAKDFEIGYEYGNFSLQSQYYPFPGASAPVRENSSFGLHRIVWFDTQGGMTSVVRGAMNESAARLEKEREIREAYRKGGTPSHVYSWEQPAPVPTDGETWALVIGSKGNLLTDTLTTQTSTTKQPSVVGLEYQHNVWSLSASPASVALGLGLRTYYFSHLKGSHSPVSIPLGIAASTQLMEGVVPYVEYSRGLMGLFNAKKFGLYQNVEAGIHWQFAPEWKAVLTHRKTHDEVSFVDNNPPNTEHDMTLTLIGVRWTP